MLILDFLVFDVFVGQDAKNWSYYVKDKAKLSLKEKSARSDN